MPEAMKHVLILAIIALVGFVTGRLAIRGLGCLLLGGTLFGGNFL